MRQYFTGSLHPMFYDYDTAKRAPSFPWIDGAFWKQSEFVHFLYKSRGDVDAEIA